MPVKQKTTDSVARIEQLIEAQERRFRNTFRQAVEVIQNAHTLDELADLLYLGRFEEALAVVERAGLLLGSAYGRALSDSAISTANFLSNAALTTVVAFDMTNQRAVDAARANGMRLVREFTADQRDTLRAAITRGVQAGENPIQQARRFKNAIGLTKKQDMAVDRYRELLNGANREGVPDSAALNRALRDRRFDSSIESAIRRGRSLTPDQINRMVARYKDRYISYRAQTIARTEALRSVHQGADVMFAQAIESGEINPELMQQKWNTRLDERERPSHAAIHGVVKKTGEKWNLGGYMVDYPGDPAAPPSETVNCRCVVTTTLLPE